MRKNKSNRLSGFLLTIGLFTSLLTGLAIISGPAGAVVVETSTPWYIMGNGCNDIALVDINQDSYPDMITANSLESYFYVRLNDGYGNFLASTQYSVSYTQFSLQVADIEGDSDPDLIFCNPSNNAVTIMYNTDGFGSFGNEYNVAVGKFPYTLSLADFDLDNDLDLVTVDRGSFGSWEYNVSVLKNDGTGKFGNYLKYTVENGPFSVGTGDVNGDNYPDIVTTHPDEKNISVLLNDKSGGFGNLAIFSVDNNPDYLFLGDLDSDNDLDIVFTDSDDEKMVVMKNDGIGNFSYDNYYIIGAGWDIYHRVKLADIDDDGDLDAVTSDDTDSTISILINDGHGGYGIKYTYPTGRSPKSIAFGDINQDGSIDIATAENYPPTKPWPPGRVSILYNEGNGWFNLHIKYPTDSFPESIALGDIDGDGDLDLVSANYDSWTSTVYFNRGDGSLGLRAEYSTYNWPNTVKLGDIDNDGDLDLLTSAGGGLTFAYVWVRMNNGDGTFTSETTYQMGKYPQLFLSDVNGDNLLDLVTANRMDSDISVRLNNAVTPGTFLGRNDYSSLTINQPRGISIGDINNDGDNDIVISNPYENNVEIFRNNGAGVFTTDATYSVGDFPTAVTFTDVDKDGDLDIVSTNSNGDSISVLLNNGVGFFIDGSVNYPVGDNPKSVDAGDVDGDADIDLVVGNNGDDTISIYKNNGYGGFGLREDYTALHYPLSVLLGDIDNDVDLDIAYTAQGISFIYNRKSIDFHMDTDGDGYPDYQDAFPENIKEWVDSDGDGYGDNMDDIPWNPFEYVDSDGDMHGDQFDDAFPQNPNEWDDSDGDGWGDNSDAFPQDNTEWLDSDNDGVGDNADFMPYDNSQIKDTDGDGYGDNAGGTNGDMFPNDSTEWWDSDGDGYGDNFQDAFPSDDTQWSDADGDGYGDNPGGNNPDLFPNNPVEWEDNDGDGIGDNGDDDDDNDGYSDSIEQSYGTDTKDANDYPIDFDGDFTPDDRDEDDDNDGFSDTMEQNLGYNSKDANDIPPDNDGDGIPDAVDEDDDNDGWTDGNDAFPNNPAGWKDTDNDGEPDEIAENAENPTNLTEDLDDDNDGYNDTVDDFPTNPNEWKDTDGDGTGDNSDSDIDNDGWSNNVEDSAGSDPNDINDTPTDTDSDGIADNADLDDDNDGVPDYDDFAPLDDNVQKDPNLIRIAGVEFEVGELVMGIMMAIGAVFLGTVVFTRKKRLYNKYKNRIEECSSVTELNEVNKEIKLDMEKEHLTYMQHMILKEQFDDKFMKLRQSELEQKLGTLPSSVEDRIREVISDKIITEDEFEGMQKWLVRLKDSKDFDSEKKEKLQEVLRVWIDENID